MSIHRNVTVTEHAIACALVVRAIRAGCSVSVYDGESFAVRKSQDSIYVLDCMASTDSDLLHFHDANTGAPIGSLVLVYGNGADVISDESAQMEALAWYAPVAELCEALSNADSPDHDWRGK